MKFVETVTLDWKSHNKIEISTDFEKCITHCVKNIRLIKPDGTPDCIKIHFSEHSNLNEDLHCEDFPVYRYFHDFKKVEYLPFALNKTGIYESVDIITESDSEFAGKLRYDVYELFELNPKLPEEILISRYDKLEGNASAFIQKNYKEESKQNQDENTPESLQLQIGEETHILSFSRFIRKAINLTFFVYEIKEPELYMDLTKVEKLPKNLFAFATVATELTN